MKELNSRLRELPHLDSVLNSSTGQRLLANYHRKVVVNQARQLISWIRDSILSGRYSSATDEESVARMLAERLEKLTTPAVRPVINATGILLHTNLGRAVFNQHTIQAVNDVAAGYSNLEFDLESGRRGKRDRQLSDQLVALCGCEDATVVNNCAAAMMIALNTMARGKQVITSRGELVEIGGSYRVPDVIPASGCQLHEVGTTNRTRVADYEKAINDSSGLLLKTHASNYRVRGFTEETSVAELVELGSRYAVPVMVDLGSGYIDRQGLPVLDEPELLETLAAGPDIVCISGDKLLGGPQAGIILGRREWVERIRRNPLWRVMRLDKLCSAALSATVSGYLRNHDESQVSVLAKQLQAGKDELEARAGKLRETIADAKPQWNVEICEAQGSVGGGSLPDQDFESVAVAITPQGMTAELLEERLRHVSIPVIGYVSRGRLLLNVASLLEGDHERIVAMFGELDD